MQFARLLKDAAAGQGEIRTDTESLRRRVPHRERMLRKHARQCGGHKRGHGASEHRPQSKPRQIGLPVRR